MIVHKERLFLILDLPLHISQPHHEIRPSQSVTYLHPKLSVSVSKISKHCCSLANANLVSTPPSTLVPKLKENEPIEDMSPPWFDGLRQNSSRTRDTLVGQVGVVSHVPDEILKNILSEADQFDARRPLWMGLRRSDETQLNVTSSPSNEQWVWKYIQTLPLEDPEYRRTLTAVEINDIWWKAFSPMAQGQTPSAKGLLSILLLACSGLGSVVHTGAAPIEINHLKVVSYLILSSREALECDFPHGAVHGDVRMGFSTRHYLRVHLNRKRLLVNVVEAKGENGELYYPTFLLDTNTWSLYIYFAAGPGSVRNEIVKLVAVAVRQMLAWAGFRPTINYYAPPITTVYANDVFGHAMIDVFMIFLTLRGWVGLDYKSVMRGRPTEPGIKADLEKSFIIPQRDWTLGEFWGSSRTDGKQPIGPYMGMESRSA